jgi:hypothetical protein
MTVFEFLRTTVPKHLATVLGNRKFLCLVGFHSLLSFSVAFKLGRNPLRNPTSWEDWLTFASRCPSSN